MRHRNAVTETTGGVFTLRCSFIGFFQFALVRVFRGRRLLLAERHKSRSKKEKFLEMLRKGLTRIGKPNNTWASENLHSTNSWPPAFLEPESAIRACGDCALTGISATTIPAVIAGRYFYPVPRSNGPALFLPLLHFEESRHPWTPGLPESIKRLDDDLMNPRSR
jgi:hypothetical protein